MNLLAAAPLLTPAALGVTFIGLAGTLMSTIVRCSTYANQIQQVDAWQVLKIYFRKDIFVFLEGLLLALILGYFAENYLQYKLLQAVTEKDPEGAAGRITATTILLMKVASFLFCLVADWFIGLLQGATKKFIIGKLQKQGLTLNEIYTPVPDKFLKTSTS